MSEPVSTKTEVLRFFLGLANITTAIWLAAFIAPHSTLSLQAAAVVTIIIWLAGIGVFFVLRFVRHRRKINQTRRQTLTG